MKIYIHPMMAVAEHLNRTLQSLPAGAAASVERLVWDVINVVELQPRYSQPENDREAAIRAHHAHIDRCLEKSAAMDWSDFERPPQGTDEIREEW